MFSDLKKNWAVVALSLGCVWAGIPASGSCVDGASIASVRYEGLEHTNSHVVDRELLHKVGSFFSKKNFETEKLHLQDLDLFTEIFVSCEPVSQESSDASDSLNLKKEKSGVNLVYHFKEIFRWIPAPAGKTTDRDGLMLGLALANLNVAGEDIRAEVQYRTAVDPFFKNNEYALYMSSPYMFGIPMGWNFEFLRTDSYDDIRDFRDDSWLVDLDLDYTVMSHFSLLASGAYRYLNFDDGRILPEFGFGFAFDFRDSKLDSRKGVYYEYMLTHVGLDEEDYWECLTDARAYVSANRFVTGATALVRYRPGDVERYDRFFHGGTNTFRGRGGTHLKNISGDESDSLRLGVHEALLTLEERFVLMERHAASVLGVNFFYGIQLVAGLDGSLLWDEGAPGWDDYEGALYGGIHLVIPALDRIRFEVGYSPDKGEPEFFFGLFDKTTTARWRGR